METVAIPLSASLLSPSRSLLHFYVLDKRSITDDNEQRTPNIYTMPPDKDGCSIGILDHCFRHAVFQIFLIRSVLNDGQFQSIKIRKCGTSATNTNALYHLEYDFWFQMNRQRKEWTHTSFKYKGWLFVNINGTKNLSTADLMRDSEDRPSPQKRCHNRMLRVGMNATASIAKVEWIPK